MKVIAVEEHVLTPEVRDAWAGVDPRHQDDSIPYYYNGPIVEGLLDHAGERLAHMDEHGIDVQVLSLTTPGVHNLERDRAVELARQANDAIAQAQRAHPDRFQGLAALPIQDPGAAADELRRSVTELGLRGAMVFGRTRERNLDHPDHEPVFAAASDLRVPLHLHAQIPPTAVRDSYYSGLPGNLDIVLATVGIGWHYEAGLQFLRMVVAGVFDRHPNLQVILGHWGNMLTFYLEELDKIPRLARTDARPISESFKRHAFVAPSGVLSARYLGWAIDVVGVDRVLLSLDYPFSRRTPGDVSAFLEHAGLSPADRQKIASGTWESLAAQVRK